MRPVDAKWPTSQAFGSFPTAGVVGDRNGTTVQRLVAQYGNYQPFGHAGEDIACPIGTPVHAIADGVVVWADWGTNLPGDDSDWGYRQRWYLYKSFPGIVTVIQHDGWLSVYGHLSSNDAAPKGTRVKEGQLMALSGDTGGVAPHLHVAAIVDTSYRTGGGLIYGCTDPSKFYGSLSYAGTITTPVQEDDMPGPHDKVFTDGDGKPASLQDFLTDIAAGVHQARDRVASIPTAFGKDLRDGDGNPASLNDYMVDIATAAHAGRDGFAGLPAAVAAAVGQVGAKDIAAALSDDLAADLAAELGKRLAGGQA